MNVRLLVGGKVCSNSNCPDGKVSIGCTENMIFLNLAEIWMAISCGVLYCYSVTYTVL